MINDHAVLQRMSQSDAFRYHSDNKWFKAYVLKRPIDPNEGEERGSFSKDDDAEQLEPKRTRSSSDFVTKCTIKSKSLNFLFFILA